MVLAVAELDFDFDVVGVQVGDLEAVLVTELVLLTVLVMLGDFVVVLVTVAENETDLVDDGVAVLVRVEDGDVVYDGVVEIDFGLLVKETVLLNDAVNENDAVAVRLAEVGAGPSELETDRVPEFDPAGVEKAPDGDMVGESDVTVVGGWELVT